MWHRRSVSLLVAVLLCTLLPGCLTQRYVKLRNDWIHGDRIKTALGSPLGIGAQEPDPRTLLLLRRYDLARFSNPASAEVLKGLADVYRRTPSLEIAHALAELNFIAAERSRLNPKKSIESYVGCMAYAWYYLFDSRYDGERNFYDPQFRSVCDLYNRSLESGLRMAKKANALKPGMEMTLTTCQGPVKFRCESNGIDWGDDGLDDFRFVSDYTLTGLDNRHQTFGLGVPMIAIREDGDGGSHETNERFYPRGLSFPVTAFLRWNQPENEGDPSSCVLELYDPLVTSNIAVAGKTIPLESDITTPLAYFLDNPRLQHLYSYGFFRPDLAEDISGLYMVQPYQPGKIPVLMVHGLLSSPMTWMEVLNELRSMPEIRDRYQFWFYLYPTGEPFWKTAADLRDDLRQVRQVFDPNHIQPELDDMVVVGHSMGGLVSRLMTLNSRDDIWNTISDTPFQLVSAKAEVRQQFERVYFFEPVPEVRRVITLAAPHQGSGDANEFYRNLLRKTVYLPDRTLAAARDLLMQNPDIFRDNGRVVPVTSLDALAPTSPLIQTLARIPNSIQVKYHNVVGVTRTCPLEEDGDGIVSYASAHRDDFDSEILVEAKHTEVHRHPLAILELRRILIEHLAETDATVFTAGHVRLTDQFLNRPAARPQEFRNTPP